MTAPALANEATLTAIRAADITPGDLITVNDRLIEVVRAMTVGHTTKVAVTGGDVLMFHAEDLLCGVKPFLF